MTSNFSIIRAEKLIKRAIAQLDLRFDSLVVLTEAGTNHFVFTPLIPYYAGAAKVLVWLKDSPFGLASEIKSEFKRIGEVLGIDLSRFEFAVNDRPISHIQLADVVTNLGSVRPMNRAFLQHLKKDAVISYMCESWEVRPEDVDISYCKAQNIKVAGVWENHPDLMIFDGCGALAIKLCFEAGLEVYQNNILVLSSDKFGKVAADSFTAVGASTVIIRHPSDISSIDFSNFDIVFIADYSYNYEILGGNIKAKVSQFRSTAIVHLCGQVDNYFLDMHKIEYYPPKAGLRFRMTQTLAHLGLKPVLDLHTAGLKVGEALFKNQKSDLLQYF